MDFGAGLRHLWGAHVPGYEGRGFRCLYCDSIRPFAVTFEDFAPEVKFRHKPVEIVEGMLKLGHVVIEDKEALGSCRSWRGSSQRTWGICRRKN